MDSMETMNIADTMNSIDIIDSRYNSDTMVSMESIDSIRQDRKLRCYIIDAKNSIIWIKHTVKIELSL